MVVNLWLLWTCSTHYVVRLAARAITMLVAVYVLLDVLGGDCAPIRSSVRVSLSWRRPTEERGDSAMYNFVSSRQDCASVQWVLRRKHELADVALEAPAWPCGRLGPLPN